MADERVTVTMVLKDVFSQPFKKISVTAGEVARELSFTTEELKQYDKEQKDAAESTEKTEQEMKKLSRGARALLISFRVMRGAVRTSITSFNRFYSTVVNVRRAVIGLKTAIVGLVAGLVLRQITRVIVGAAEQIDTFAKSAQGLGLATEELVRLAFAADRSGVAFDQLKQSAAQLLRNLGNASTGQNKRAADALQQLGLTASDVDLRLSPLSETIVKVARALERIDDPGRRVSLLNAIFGEEASVRLIPLLNQGADGIRRLFDEADRLVTINDEQARVSEDLIDSITNLKFAWLSLKAALLVEVGPAITATTNRLAFFIADAPDRIRGITRALRDAFSTDSTTQEAATKLFQALKVQVARFIVTLAVESGRVIGTAFLEAIAIGLVALSPVIEDVFRTALGPVLSAIPGIDVEPTVAKRIAKLREVQSEYDKLIRKATQLEKILDEDPRLDGQDRIGLQQELSGTRRQIALLEGDLTDLDALLREQDRENKDRAEAFRIAVRSGFEATTGAAEEARLRIASANDGLAEVLDTFKALGQDAPEDIQAVTLSIDPLKAALNSASTSAKNLLSGVKAIAAGIPAALTQLQQLSQELQARALSATGRPDEAERLRLLIRFRAERVQLEQQLGSAAAALIPELERVQQLELQRFDAELKVREAVDSVIQAEQEYQAALATRNAEVEAGAVVTEEQEARLAALRDTLSSTIEAAKASLQSIGQDSRFADVAVDGLKRIELAAAGLRETTEQTARTFKDGLVQGVKDFGEQSKLSFESARQLANNVLTTIGDGLVGAIRNAITGAQSLKEAFVGAIANIAADIAALIARMLIMKAIASSFGGGFGALFAQTGGVVGPGGGHMQRFALGGIAQNRGSGIIPGPAVPRDVTPVLAMPGEGFIRKSAVQYYGKGMIAAINQKLLPRALFSGNGVLTNVIGNGKFASGGLTGGSTAQASPSPAGSIVQPALIADESTMQTLLSGGAASMLRFLRDNRGQY